MEEEISGTVTITANNTGRDSGIGDYCSRIHHRIQQNTPRTVRSHIAIDTLNRHAQSQAIKASRHPDFQHPASKDSKYPDTRNHLYSSTFRKHHNNLTSLYLPSASMEPIPFGHRISSHRHRHRHRLASAPTCIDRQHPDHRLSLRPHTHAPSNKQQQASQRTPVLRPTPALCCCRSHSPGGETNNPEAMTLRASTAARQRCMSCILPTDQFTFYPPSRRLNTLSIACAYGAPICLPKEPPRPHDGTAAAPESGLSGSPSRRRLLFWGEDTTASCRTHCDGIGKQ